MTSETSCFSLNPGMRAEASRTQRVDNSKEQDIIEHQPQPWRTNHQTCLKTLSGRYAVRKQSNVKRNLCTDFLLIGGNNAYLVKRKTAGGVQFSRDPLNLMNKHSRKVSSEIYHYVRDNR